MCQQHNNDSWSIYWMDWNNFSWRFLWQLWLSALWHRRFKWKVRGFCRCWWEVSGFDRHSFWWCQGNTQDNL